MPVHCRSGNRVGLTQIIIIIIIIIILIIIIIIIIIKRVKNKKRRDWGEIIGSRLSRARAHELRVTRELS